MTDPRHIFGIHDPGGEHLMAQAGRTGWIVFTEELGHDPTHTGGRDYRPWAEKGYGIIARLNNGYGDRGTIPAREHYGDFARRVANWVAASPGCHIWIIGNEMNHQQERPAGQSIMPGMYANCYVRCQAAIHDLPGHEEDQVVAGAVAPWNNTTAYVDNPVGNWVYYFEDVLAAIEAMNGTVDAVALHTYTHGPAPDLVTADQPMGAPFQDHNFEFREYQNFMRAIPDHLRAVPVYITECTQVAEPGKEASFTGWENENRGWVQAAYREIDEWNAAPGHQQIRCVALYRWKHDRWHIDGRSGVQLDFLHAMLHDYTWRAEASSDDGWRLVERWREPEDRNVLLAVYLNGHRDMLIGHYRGDVGWVTRWGALVQGWVTHWRELPALPKEEER